MDHKLYCSLLELIEEQEDMIRMQNCLITDLVNENMEKENYIIGRRVI